jgi:Flp pilus assembly pilin Flp
MRFINDSMLRLFVWFKEEKAQTMAEYGLILALVSVAAIIVLGTVGTQLGGVFTRIANSLHIT